jgi:hypothetical protein
MKSLPEILGLTVMVTKRHICGYCVGGCVVESKQWRSRTDKEPPKYCVFHKSEVNPKWEEC